jgi:hypothetical protein
MTYIFYTFRPQINDQQLFEDFLKLFVPFVESHKEYAYSVESDGTLSKHLHAVLGSPLSGKDYQDIDKFYQKFNKANGLKEFKTFAKTHANTTEVAFKPMKVKETKEDLQHTLGYTLKEHATRQATNFPNQQVLDSVEYYYAHMRIKAKDNTSKDWTLLSGKNAHAHIERYIQDNDIKLPDPLLGTRLVADRYSFINMSEKQCKQVQAEIHLARAKEAGVAPDLNEEEQVYQYTNNAQATVMFDDYVYGQAKLKEAYEEIASLKERLSKYEKLNEGYMPIQAAYKS